MPAVETCAGSQNTQSAPPNRGPRAKVPKPPASESEGAAASDRDWRLCPDHEWSGRGRDTGVIDWDPAGMMGGGPAVGHRDAARSRPG